MRGVRFRTGEGGRALSCGGVLRQKAVFRVARALMMAGGYPLQRKPAFHFLLLPTALRNAFVAWEGVREDIRPYGMV